MRGDTLWPGAASHRNAANHYVRCGVVAVQREGAAVLGPVKDAVRRYAVACGHP